MDHVQAGAMWDGNAQAWTKLARQGYDICARHINTPAFLAMLPEVATLSGLDIGCGEGHNTRLLAGRGATMTAVDISPKFIDLAREQEQAEPLGIVYRVASAVELPFPGEAFHFAVAFMSLMDIPDLGCVLREAFRVVKAGGFLQFSITHPCTDTPVRGWLRDEVGRKVALQCGGYFDQVEGRVDEWLFSAAPPEATQGLAKFRTPKFFRTLTTWLNALLDAGFVLERFAEPYADDAAVRRFPRLEGTRLAPYWLIVRCRKPAVRAGAPGQ
jgi:ubiquinone/menaquinone biosynthesis C-methylase UbiE